MQKIPSLIAVAMSGGVDSSVTAALLAEQGYAVIGLTLHLWRDRQGESADPPSSLAQAGQVARQLNIPHHVIHAVDRFKQTVVAGYLDALRRGLTPNPCVYCNHRIKWGYLWEQAQALGADCLATGHYARLETDPGGKVRLRKGKDAAKDQSYFLCRLSQEQLSHTLFPLGNLTKKEVRGIAHRYQLAAADRQESQDLCFLGDTSPTEFLLRHAPDTAIPGPITDQQGKILGEHQGLAFYTIGQRKGIKIAGARPYYVLRKEVAENKLVIGYEDELGSREMLLTDVNWIAGGLPDKNFKAQIKIRYRSPESWAEISPQENGQAFIRLDQPLRDITPGQIAAIYDGEYVLGGGMIMETR